MTRQRLWGAAGFVVAALAGWWALRPALAVPVPTEANLAEERMQDFRDATYFPIREFLAGGDPYNTAAMLEHWPVRQGFNLYQPYHLVLHAPFALPDYRVGALAFAACSLALLVALALMAASRTGLPLLVAAPVLAAFLLASQVGKAQLYLGQVNPLIAVAVAGALLARRGHPGWAGVALAVAWIKPQFGLPLAVLLFARGSRRVALSGTTLAAAASLPVVALLVARDGGLGGFLDVIRGNIGYAAGSDYVGVNSVTGQRVDVAAVLFRLTGASPPAAELVVLVVVLAVTAWLLRHRRGDLEPNADLLTCLALVACVVHEPGDALVAIPAATAAAAAWWRSHDAALAVVLLLFLVPFVHLHAVDVLLQGLLGARLANTVDGAALVAAWLVLAALWLARSRTPTRVGGRL